MRETLTSFLLTAAIVLYIMALQKKAKSWTVAAGMGFGLLALSRPEYIFAIFLLSAYMFIVNRNLSSDALRKSLIFIVCAVIVISPWTIRNYLVFKKPIIISVGGRGYGTFFGTFLTLDNYTVGNKFPDEIYKDAQEKEKIEALRLDYIKAMRAGTIDIKKYDDAFLKLTMERIHNNPAKVIKTWIKRIPYVWYQNYNANPKQIKSFFIGNYFIFYFLFAIFAWLNTSRKEKYLMSTIALLFIYLSLVLLPTPAIPRYGLPLMPAFITLSGVGLWNLTVLIINRLLPSYQLKREI